MALKPDTVQFFIDRIGRSSYTAVEGIAAQLFNYLKTEVKDNPVYDKYEGDRAKWENWPGEEDDSGWPDWRMPDQLDDAKSLAYDIYKSIGSNGPGYLIARSSSLFHHRGHSENLNELNQTFLGYLAQALEDIVNANPEIADVSPKHVPGTTVFIIHGHDNELKMEVQLLLSRAGVHAVVLHEQADMGRTIIDKLVEEAGVAGYAIALLTPDDLTDKGNSRARQNVILEIGYFLGKIGKARLRMLVKQSVEIPSDLQGILYEKHDAAGAWKFKLLKEMRAVGINLDINAALTTF